MTSVAKVSPHQELVTLLAKTFQNNSIAENGFNLVAHAHHLVMEGYNWYMYLILTSFLL
jgi:hypothetical protein